MIDFSQNFFALFGLPQRYRVDAAALDGAYRALQTSVHPDRHATGSDADRRIALQASARVNEAYRALRDPVERAEYLLRLRGIDVSAETDNQLPVDFLTRQLMRRETAEEAEAEHDEEALGRVIADVREDAAKTEAVVAQTLDGVDLGRARLAVRELRFLAKLADDLAAQHAMVVDR
jgi:molecular chaperone HscB